MASNWQHACRQAGCRKEYGCHWGSIDAMRCIAVLGANLVLEIAGHPPDPAIRNAASLVKVMMNYTIKSNVSGQHQELDIAQVQLQARCCRPSSQLALQPLATLTGQLPMLLPLRRARMRQVLPLEPAASQHRT